MVTERKSTAVPPPLRDKPWMSVMVRLEQYAKLKEIAAFRGTAMGKVLHQYIDQDFEKMLVEARTTAHDSPTRKESDVSDHTPPVRRYRF